MIQGFSSFSQYFDPADHLRSIIKWLERKHKSQRLNCCLGVVDRTELRRRKRSSREPSDPSVEIRVSEVVKALSVFCKTHQKKLEKDPSIWDGIQIGILEPLNRKTRRQNAKSIAMISDEISKLSKDSFSIKYPPDPRYFPPLDQKSLALLNQMTQSPWRYRLSVTKRYMKTGREKKLVLIDRIQNTRTSYDISYSIHSIASEPFRLLLVSKRTAGEGEFTKARICWDLYAGEWMVLKNRGIDPQAKEIIQQLSQKKIPGVVPIWVSEGNKWRMYEPLCPKDLFTILTKGEKEGILPHEKRRIALQLLTILVNLHQEQYHLPDGSSCPAFHGDIKPENILYTFNKELVFTDFGSTHPKIISGTHLYAAPQILGFFEEQLRATNRYLYQSDLAERALGIERSRQSMDIWSMGILLLQILEVDVKKTVPGVTFIANCLYDEQVSNRSISQKEIDEDLLKTLGKFQTVPELVQICGCIPKMLRVNPEERISAQEALLIASGKGKT